MLHGAESIGIHRSRCQRAVFRADGGGPQTVRASAQPDRSSAPKSRRSRSTIAATTGSLSSLVSVRSWARSSIAKARLLVPGSSGAPRNTSNNDAPAQQIAGRILDRRLDFAGDGVIGDDEREVAADGRVARHVVGHHRVRGDRQQRHRAPARRPPGAPRSRSRTSDPRVQLPHHPDARVADEHPRGTAGMEREAGSDRPGATRGPRAPPSAAPSTPVASSASKGRGSMDQCSSAGPDKANATC